MSAHGNGLHPAHPSRRTAKPRAGLLAPALALSCALLVGGCATPPPADEGWRSGRLALRVDAEGNAPAQALSAVFELRGEADGRNGDLRLSSPLGARIASARWAPGEAVLTTAEGERRFESLQALSLQALGQPLPLQALAAWVDGQPWPGAAHLPLPAPAIGFVQLGWTLDLARRSSGSIEARREQPPPALRLVLRLDTASAR